MTNRMYQGLLGTLILIFLYIGQSWLIYTLIALLFFEGITGLTVPRVVNHLFGLVPRDDDYRYENHDARWSFSAERAWKLLVGGLLLLSYGLLYQYLWVIPWFFGFAILGSGISRVCPAMYVLKWAGFK